MMPQSARILSTAYPKPVVPLEDYQRECGRVTRSASPQRFNYTEPSSFSPSCTVQRPVFSIGSRSGYWSGFTNVACAPSLASNGKTTYRTKKSSREPSCPAQSPSCFRCICAWLATLQGWKTYACLKKLFFSELQESKRDRGAPRKRYKDQLKRRLAQAGTSHRLWQQEASDRDSWRSSVRKASL